MTPRTPLQKLQTDMASNRLTPCFKLLFLNIYICLFIFWLLPPPRRIIIVVVCLSVCFFCLLATLCKNFQTDLYEIFREGWQWASQQTINFWWRSGSRIRMRIRIRFRIATLVRRALAEVCTVPVLLVLYLNLPDTVFSVITWKYLKFADFEIRAIRFFDFKNAKFQLTSLLTMALCVTMQYFIAIFWAVADIWLWRYIGWQNAYRPPCWILPELIFVVCFF